jgi:hypothetical protein
MLILCVVSSCQKIVTITYEIKTKLQIRLGFEIIILFLKRYKMH